LTWRTGRLESRNEFCRTWPQKLSGGSAALGPVTSHRSQVNHGFRPCTRDTLGASPTSCIWLLTIVPCGHVLLETYACETPTIPYAILSCGQALLDNCSTRNLQYFLGGSPCILCKITDLATENLQQMHSVGIVPGSTQATTCRQSIRLRPVNNGFTGRCTGTGLARRPFSPVILRAGYGTGAPARIRPSTTFTGCGKLFIYLDSKIPCGVQCRDGR
jgi:hypothetical protein